MTETTTNQPGQPGQSGQSGDYERPTVTVPLFTGGDLQRIEALRAELMDAASSTVVGPRLLSETTPDGADDLKALAAAHDDFVREATARARKVTIQALPRRRKRDMVTRHPARMVSKIVTDEDGTERAIEVPHEDDTRGFNHETMADELVPASIVADQFTSVGAMESFVENLSDPHFNALYSAAIRLNYEGDQVPKAEASSLVDRIIAAISTSPEDSD